MSSLLTNLIRGCHKIFNPIFLMNPNHRTSEVWKSFFQQNRNRRTFFYPGSLWDQFWSKISWPIHFYHTCIFRNERCTVQRGHVSWGHFLSLFFFRNKRCTFERGHVSRGHFTSYRISLFFFRNKRRTAERGHVSRGYNIHFCHTFLSEINDAQLREVMSREVTIFGLRNMDADIDLGTKCKTFFILLYA